MTRFLKQGLLVVLFSLAGIAATLPSYVVQVKPGTPFSPLASEYQLTVIRSWHSSTVDSYSVSSATPLSTGTLKQLSQEPGVLEAETDSDIESSESDQGSKAATQLESLGNLFATRATVSYYGANVLGTYVTQPGTQIIGLGAALASFAPGSGVVAVIDTGVDPNHPALQGAIVPGYDFTRDRPDTWSELNDLDPAVASALNQSTVEILDAKTFVVGLSQSTVEILDQSTVEILDGKGLPSAFGHGTMVSGLIHLVAPNAQIMPLKAFHSDGSASLFDIDHAIRYATDHGASVISMSFSYPTSSDILQASIAYAQSHGVVMVASAGNDGRNMAVYPASYSGVVGVGSTNFSDRRSLFSNYGKAADTSAPGEALVTLYPGGNYAAVWGTSFSTALVAGAATLMKPIRPKIGGGYFRDALEHGAQIDQGMGDARLDLVKLLTYCLSSKSGD